MKCLFTFLSILTLTNISYAQVAEYNFSNFLFPDLQRQTFRITPFVDLDYSNPTNSTQTTNVAGSLFADFTSFNFTRDKQSNTSIFSNIGFRESNRETSFFPYNQLFFEFAYLRDNKIYIDDNQFINLDFSFDADLAKVTPNSDREVHFNLQTTPTLGYGRVEIVTDVWHGIALVNSLQEKGLLLVDLSEEDITALGKKIAEIKNTRRVDFRHEEIFEREMLFEYFVSNNLININDYRSITTLIDAWRFEDFTTRQHGKTIEYGFSFEYDILDISKFSNGQRFNSEALTIIYNSRNAKSLKNQIDHSIGLEGGFWNLRPFNDLDTDKRHFYQLDYTLNYGYYLSARTNLIFRLNASTLNFIKSDEYRHSVSANLIYNYYISPNFRFSIIGQASTFEQDLQQTFFNDTQRANLSVRFDYFVY